MESTWKVLLLLGLATTAIAIRRQTLTFKGASVLAASRFNKNLQEGAKFRVLESSLATPNARLVLLLKFRIKETVCASTEQQNSETCAFRENGSEKECTARFSQLSRFGLSSVECEDIGNNTQTVRLIRFKRSTDDGDIDIGSLPPNIRNIYNQAKYDIISRIMSNFK
ncbi:neutrophilic granule protein-like [Macrotis lagotis]|uniref:neutrophilic granule protein-like n=1 Tax=Macrotis lagotis TaxID=92651 RepID=UPI003D681151